MSPIASLLPAGPPALRPKRLRRYCISSASLSLALLALGCSGGFDYGPTGMIEGRLTMDGKPLPAGHNVSFMDMQKGYLAFGTTDESGNFEVKSWNDGNMPVGTYKVMIAPPAGTPPAEPESYTSEQLFDNPELMDAPAGKTLYPRRYANTATSGLEYAVKEGENRFEIDLELSRSRD